MTDRLYYTEPYLQAFDAVVSRAERRLDRLVVTLDRTAFYPTSGGQPFDTGTLGGLPVVDVVDADDGSIEHVVTVEPGTGAGDGRGSDLHLVPRPTLTGAEWTPGTPVHGVINWPRRFDHMQQHTGQHVLSAASERLFGVRTVGFHLGAAVSTVDLARELTPAEMACVEDEANRVVWEDRPVGIRFASAEEAARLPLRKESAREGTLRLVDVDGFDLSACGGTHVARTGGIGVIAVASWERFKGGQRVEFLCGGRALGRFRALRDTVGAAVRRLSVLAEALPESIERLLAEVKEQKRSLADLQEELARFRARDLAESADPVRLTPDATSGTRPCRLVLRAIDADANGLKALASAIITAPGYLVVLASTSRPALVVVARSSDVSASAQKLVASLTAAFGGRGGGKPELAQCGGLDASTETILAAARTAAIAGD
jgi:alanyl-tRNA synthetase